MFCSVIHCFHADPDFELGGSKEELGAQKVALEQECNAFEAKIDDEVAKFKRWKVRLWCLL